MLAEYIFFLFQVMFAVVYTALAVYVLVMMVLLAKWGWRAFREAFNAR